MGTKVIEMPNHRAALDAAAAACLRADRQRRGPIEHGRSLKTLHGNSTLQTR